MYTKNDLLNQLEEMGIDSRGSLLVHSSYKSIGPVEGGPDTVLDSLSDYMQEGLLVLPTHTWNYINADNPNFYVADSPSNVGILTERFRKRPGVYRSYHPTHSVAALGKDAQSFVQGDEKHDTPCARGSSLGKLLNRKGQIILVGVDLTRNTFIHGIEEWNNVPNRMADTHEALYTILPDGTKISVPSRRHSGLSWSEHYWKIDDHLLASGAMWLGKLGDAEVRICDAVKLTEVVSNLLQKNPDLFLENKPLTD